MNETKILRTKKKKDINILKQTHFINLNENNISKTIVYWKSLFFLIDNADLKLCEFKSTNSVDCVKIYKRQ